ncbi:MAG: hypothetical protein U1F57_00645 [bacterium]
MIDFQIAVSERTFRRLKGAPRYFEVGPLIPNFVPTATEATAQAEAENKAKAEEHAKTESRQQQQRPAPQQTTSHQASRMDQAVRDARGTDSREGASQHEGEHRALKDASQQGVQELRHSEFVENATNPQQGHTGSAFRAPSSSGGNVLQNIRVLTGEAHPEQGHPMGHTEGNVANLVRGDAARPQTPAGTGVRVGDFARFAGVHEGGQLPMGTPNDPALARWAGGRGGMPQAQPFSPDSPFARLADRMMGRAWSPDNLANLLNQATSHMAESHPALANRNAQVAVVLHGSLLFVKDGERFRAFRLMDDGTLWEANPEEHHGSPLSPEARSEITKLLRQKGVHARLSGDKEALVDEKHLEHSSAAQAKQAKDHSHSARGEFRTLFRDDSSFAHLLREVLEEGREVGEFLGEGEDAHFASKSDWGGFFSRMMGMGSSEKSSKSSFDEIMGFIFRGLFKKKGQAGETLVSDIKYKGEGLKKEEKFAQIGVDNEELLEFLKNLKPGQPISKELLQSYFGEDITFIQLLHVIQKADPVLASELLRNVQFDPSANVDPYSQARLEHHIFSRSRPRPTTPLPTSAGDSQNGAIFANVYDLQDKQKRDVKGKPKLYTLISYTVIIFGVLLLIFYLLNKG